MAAAGKARSSGRSTQGKLGRAQRELAEFDRVFSALAHATRRHILIVIEAKGGRVRAGQIAERFSHSWPTVTRHLSVLREAGVVDVEVVGRERIYAIDKELLFRAGRGWFDHFEED
jgi:DNA-binding transcriptional ArsR family regulator